MTGKLPVERTISDAYRFAFARFLSILGTIWLPYLVLALIAFALLRLVAPDRPRMLAASDFDLAAGMEALRFLTLVGIVAFIIGAMVTVDLQHKAMGTRTGLPYVFFSVGAPVWRMAGASFLALVVIGVIAVVSGLVCFAIWSAAAGLGAGGALIRLVAILATIGLDAYIALRLMFFLPAVVVAENSIGLERAWALGGHNFWRILVVAIAVILPVVIVFHLLSWAVFGTSMTWPAPGGRGGVRELLRAGLMQFGAKSYLILLLQLIERIVVLGVFNGAVASAYLAIGKQPDTSAPAAPAA